MIRLALAAAAYVAGAFAVVVIGGFVVALISFGIMMGIF